MSASLAPPSPAFLACFAFTIGVEGGYWVDPAAGPTNWGISAKAYPGIDIATLTKAQAEAIYWQDYWCKYGCHLLPHPIAAVTFDAYVNGGHPGIWLQNVVGAQADGSIGPSTATATATYISHNGAPSLLGELIAQRIVYDSDLGNWEADRLGWARRLLKLAFFAESLGEAGA